MRKKTLRLTKKNLEDRRLFYYKCKKFGIDKILKDVAFSDEMPAKLNENFNPNNMGCRDFKKNRPIFVKFKNKFVSLNTYGVSYQAEGVQNFIFWMAMKD